MSGLTLICKVVRGGLGVGRRFADRSVLFRFATKEVMESWFKHPKMEEVNRKIFDECLMDGEVDARFYRRIGGTRD